MRQWNKIIKWVFLTAVYFIQAALFVLVFLKGNVTSSITTSLFGSGIVFVMFFTQSELRVRRIAKPTTKLPFYLGSGAQNIPIFGLVPWIGSLAILRMIYEMDELYEELVVSETRSKTRRLGKR